LGLTVLGRTCFAEQCDTAVFEQTAARIMDQSSFENLIERSLRRLPRKFLDALQNIAVEIEQEPSEDILDDMGIESGTLYGLYQGVPLTEREWNFGNVLPDRIIIYQGPIERDARSPEDIEAIVLETVMHEIGHYFGFDDDALYDIEDEKAKRKKKR
jgi:predicted Zn-dependent protease with MMP-like domain